MPLWSIWRAYSWTTKHAAYIGLLDAQPICVSSRKFRPCHFHMPYKIQHPGKVKPMLLLDWTVPLQMQIGWTTKMIQQLPIFISSLLITALFCCLTGFVSLPWILPSSLQKCGCLMKLSMLWLRIAGQSHLVDRLNTFWWKSWSSSKAISKLRTERSLGSCKRKLKKQKRQPWMPKLLFTLKLVKPG